MDSAVFLTLIKLQVSKIYMRIMICTVNVVGRFIHRVVNQDNQRDAGLTIAV